MMTMDCEMIKSILISILIFFPHLILIDGEEVFDFCPVSNLMNVVDDGLFTYPIPVLHKQSDEDLKVPTYECEYADSHVKKSICTNTLQYCPLQDDFVSIALTNDLYGYDFCDFRDALYNKENSDDKPINILIFGGSVTKGEHTEGAYCNTKLNSNCNTNLDLTRRRIGWPTYLTKWLLSHTSANIKIHHLEHGGTSSGWAAENLIEFLKDNKIDKLFSRDIVFIDYSINDQETAFSAQTLTSDLHDLLHKILHHADSLESTAQRPRIVMLAADPVNGPFGSFVYQVYLETAHKFGASFWSYIDVSYSPYGSAYGSTSEDLYRFVRGEGAGLNKHINWFAHLFTADLYASILKYIMSSCDLDPDAIEDADSISARYIRKPSTPWSLPPLEMQEVGCGRDDTGADHMKLDVHAGIDIETATPKVTSTITPAGSWRLYEDRRGKPGWIIETEMSESRRGNLTFSIPFVNASTSHYLRVEFLRTYEHAGTAEIFLCGQHIITLDALWQNPENYKKSISFFRTILLDNIQNCEESSIENNGVIFLDIVSPAYLPPEEEKLNNPHKSIRSLKFFNTTRVLRNEAHRGRAKFKLISINMCD